MITGLCRKWRSTFRSVGKRQFVLGLVFAVVGLLISFIAKIEADRSAIAMFFVGMGINILIEGKGVIWSKYKLWPPKPILGFWAYFWGSFFLMAGIVGLFWQR